MTTRSPTWRAELDAAGEIAADEDVGRMLANPAAPLESREEMAQSIFGKVVSKPVLNMIQLLLRRGRIDQLPTVAAEFRRLDNARQGITLATATSAAPLSAGRDPGDHRAARTTHRRSRRARRPGRSQPAGWPDRAGRRPPDRR